MNKNTAGFSVIFFWLSMALLLSFSACDNTLGTRQTARGTGSVRLIIDEVSGRTIRPDPDAGVNIISSYTLEFTNTITTDVVSFERPRASSYTIVLETGKYNLLVSAWIGTGLAAKGELKGIDIDENVIRTYPVTLGALMNSNEKGTFRWSITFPAGLKSASMTITPVDSTGTAEQTIQFTTGTTSSSASRTLDVGYYIVTFELVRDDKDYQKIIFHDILHIYQNLESYYSRGFTNDHFSAIKYSVTFVYDNGTTQIPPVNFWHGDLIDKNTYKPLINKPIPAGLYQPTPPTSATCTFDDYYVSGVKWDYTKPVTGNMTLTAHWYKAANLVDVSAADGSNDAAKAVSYAVTHADTYTLLLGAPNPAANTSVNIGNYTLPANCKLTIKRMGTGERGILGASADSPLFTINGAGASLTLDSGITLYGKANGTTPLVTVTNGSLIMKTGSKITGHTTSSPNGAVYISNVGTFTMEGGEITRNRSTSTAAASAGGVYAAGSGAINIQGGTIGPNTIPSLSLWPGDVFKENGGSLNLSGSAKIFYLTLSANASINSISAWSGSVSGLNLYAAVSAIDGVKTSWENERVLPSSVSASTVDKFTLGNFISSGGSTQPITNGYYIPKDTSDIGKLVKKPNTNFSGTLTISKNGNTLTASYSGSENVSYQYQWNKNGNPVPGSTGTIYTPSESGTYTVTISAPGYNDLTSNPITVTINVIGSGTESDPWIVRNVEDLSHVGKPSAGDYANWTLDKHYKQASDIDLSAVPNWTSIGSNSARFTGSYDGNGKIIANLTINDAFVSDQGLFGSIGQGALVENIILENCNITTTGGVGIGGIAGSNFGAIRKCFVSGNITGGGYTGGIVGANMALLQNCSFNGNVTGEQGVGGITGGNSLGLIENCYTTGEVKGETYVGGICGSNNSGILRNCVALVTNITITDESGSTFDELLFGRITGGNYDPFNCYALTDMKMNDETYTSWLNRKDSIDGASIVAAQWENEGWWKTEDNWYSSETAWDFIHIWEWDSESKLPKLRNTGGQ